MAGGREGGGGGAFISPAIKKKPGSQIVEYVRTVHTVFIGEEDTMVNKIVVVDKIVHLGPPLGHCRGLLYKIV